MLWRAPWLRQRLTLMGLAFWDGLLLYLGYNLTYWIRLEDWLGANRGLAVLLVLWLGLSYLLGRYSEPEQNQPQPVLLKLATSLGVAGIILALVIGHSWLFRVTDAETRFRGFLIPLLGSVAIGSTLGQLMRQRLVGAPRRWLLLCNNLEQQVLLRELAGRGESSLRVAQLITPEDVALLQPEQWQPRTALAISEQSSLDEAAMQRLLQLRAQGIQICSLVNWAERCLQRVPPELLSNRWLLQAEGFAIQPGRLGWRVKRLGDVVGSAILLLISSPVLMTAGALIWLEDRGPVLYSQVRTGLYGRRFRIWKLRTMRVDAEAKGVQWASRSDPRITRIGGVLRVLRLDELPQLVGVLNGDLSLIGPRPERPEIEEQLERAIPHYRIRHWIRPGLSGWAQVCHPYGASLADSRMKLSYDLYYLRNAGLLLDALITLKTIRLVSGARGAVPSTDPEPAPLGL